MSQYLTEDVASQALDDVNTAITLVHDLLHAVGEGQAEVKALAEVADDVLRRLEQTISRVSGVPIP